MAETTGRGCWDEDDATHDVLQAIKVLTSNELRTSTADREANEELMSQDLAEVLGRGPGAGGEQESAAGSGVRGIEYVDVNCVSNDEFERMFVIPGRPCMIRGCADGWPAREKWASAKALVQHRGDVQVRLTELYNLPRSYFPSAKPQAVRVPLKNFCAYANSNAADFPWYGFEDDFTCGGRDSLLGDFTIPRYFVEDCYDASEEARSLFPKAKFFIVGGARTGTGLHVDPSCTSAWNTLLCGRKRWVLFPPGSDDAYMELLGVQEEYSRKGTQPCKWWREDYARVANAGGDVRSEMIECVQGPGETIYVPHGWWHAVLNLDFTVAVTANPLPPASLHSTWGKLCESLTKDTARRFAKQCAEKWPDHILRELDHLEGEHSDGNAGVDEKLLAMARGEDEEGEEEEVVKNVGVEAMHGGEDAADFQQLRDMGRKRGSEQRQRGCIMFFDVDGALRSQGKEGGLRNEGIAALGELVEATGAEIVLTSGSRVAEATRLAVKAR
jgi:hypothetical protein